MYDLREVNLPKLKYNFTTIYFSFSFKFTNGAIREHHVQVGLTARQCLEISETALEIGEINAATEWFQAAHFKGVQGFDNSLSIDDLTQSWGKTYQAVRFYKECRQE